MSNGAHSCLRVWLCITAILTARSLTIATEAKSKAPTTNQRPPTLKAIPLPRSVLEQIAKIAPGAVADTNGCGLSTSDYSAWETILSDTGASAVVAQGRTACLCPDGNCSFWIFQKTSGGIALLLNDVGVHDFYFKSARTNGYLDIVISTHNAPFNYKLDVYRFDGTSYMLEECWDRSFAQWNRHGKIVRIYKRARTTREGCPQL